MAQPHPAHPHPPPTTPSIINTDPSRVPPPNADPVELEQVFNLKNIQGDILVDLNQPQHLYLGLQIADVAATKQWLTNTVRPNLTTTWDVMALRDKFRVHHKELQSKEKAFQRLDEEGVVQECMNIGISYTGLKKLGVESTFSDPPFEQDLIGTYKRYGDPPPDTWVVGREDSIIDIFVKITGNTLEHVARMRNKVITGNATPPGGGGILTIVHDQDGGRLPAHEHFGFADGMGQPGFRGVYIDALGKKAYFSPRAISTSDPTHDDYAQPGRILVWPGEFLFGYVTPDPKDPKKPFEHGSSPYFGTFPDWAKDGSLLVYRRLREDVPKFWNFVRKEVAKEENFPLGITEEKFSSLMVGRWKSGAPLMRSPHADDPELGAQLESNNNFFFVNAKTPTPLRSHGDQPDKWEVSPADPRGIRCPFGAHMRKVEPHDTEPHLDDGLLHDGLLHRIFRRGSNYGTQIADRFTDDGADRGLIFISYQASITQGILFQQEAWANNSSFPEKGTGHDFLIGQPPLNEDREFRLEVPTAHGGSQQVQLRTHDRWVIPTGGGHFFLPPIDFFAPGSVLFRE